MTDEAELRANPEAPLRAAVYARISLDRNSERVGVGVQVEDSLKLIASHGWTHVRTFQDNSLSASTGRRRPAYEKMLEAVEAGEVDVIVAWNNDRLHRRLDDLEHYVRTMERTDCRTYTVKGGDLRLNSANGRLVARLLGSVAAAESEVKAERVARRREHEAKLGRAHGPLGYGYRDDRTIEPDQATVVAEIAERLLHGETLYAVAADLTERGVPSPGAGKWTAKHIAAALIHRPALRPLIGSLRSDAALDAATAARLLRNAGATMATSAEAVRGDFKLNQWLLLDDSSAPDGQIALVMNRAGIPAPPTTWRASNLGVMIRRGALCGWRDFGPGGRGGRGEMVARGDWTPILTKETTDALRALLDSRKAPLRTDRRPHGGRPPKFLLSGVLVCGRCGERMSGYCDSATGASKYSCTKVPGTRRCGRLSIAGPAVEEAVCQAVRAALTGTRLRQRSAAHDEASEHEAAQLVLLIRSEIEAYRNMAKQRKIAPTEFLDIRQGLEARLREAERALGERALDVRAVLEGVPSTQDELETWWASASLARRREVVRTLIERVPVAPAQSVQRVSGLTREERLLARLGAPIWKA